VIIKGGIIRQLRIVGNTPPKRQGRTCPVGGGFVLGVVLDVCGGGVPTEVQEQADPIKGEKNLHI